MAGFVDQIDRINAAAEASEGFVWRLEMPDPEVGPCHKYGRIRPPMHPASTTLSLRFSGVEYCGYAPSSRLAGRGGGGGAASISTPSVRGRIYDTDH